MAGIFPETNDGGLPPNPADPNLPKAAYPPVTAPLNTAALYYGNGCDVRLRPEQLNSLISEVEATVDQAGVAYDASRRENLEIAVRYLIQRGLQTGTIANGGPAAYTLALDPTLTAHNNYLTLVVVPAVANNGPVTFDTDARGVMPVLRNDGQQLQANDLKAGVPVQVSWFNGAWFVDGMVASQLPPKVKILTAPLDLWVRTDGVDDPSHDGTANTAASAFRTVQYVINSIIPQYMPSATFGFNIRLGNPGDYEGFQVQSSANSVDVWGDLGNPAAYRFVMMGAGSSGYTVVAGAGVVFRLHGVTCLCTLGPQPGQSAIIGCHGADMILDAVRIETLINNPNTYMLNIADGSVRAINGVWFFGNAHTVTRIITINDGGVYSTGTYAVRSQLQFTNIVATDASIMLRNLSTMDWSQFNVTSTGCTGLKYSVQGNSVFSANANQVPGNANGTTTSGGQFIEL